MIAFPIYFCLSFFRFSTRPASLFLLLLPHVLHFFPFQNLSVYFPAEPAAAALRFFSPPTSASTGRQEEHGRQSAPDWFCHPAIRADILRRLTRDISSPRPSQVATEKEATTNRNRLATLPLTPTESFGERGSTKLPGRLADLLLASSSLQPNPPLFPIA